MPETRTTTISYRSPAQLWVWLNNRDAVVRNGVRANGGEVHVAADDRYLGQTVYVYEGQTYGSAEIERTRLWTWEITLSDPTDASWFGDGTNYDYDVTD